VLYWPLLSVTADRTFSISAGLDASTVTPGRTAPEVSLTVPAMPLVCADAVTGSSRTTTAPQMIRANVRMPRFPPELSDSRRKCLAYCAAVVPHRATESRASLRFFFGLVRRASKLSYRDSRLVNPPWAAPTDRSVVAHNSPTRMPAQ